MGAAPVHFSSLDRVAERVVEQLRRERDTVVIGSPGCGMTTFVSQLAAAVAGDGFRVNRFDAQVKKVSALAEELARSDRWERRSKS
jgi:MoxR-like ATPase